MRSGPGLALPVLGSRQAQFDTIAEAFLRLVENVKRLVSQVGNICEVHPRQPGLQFARILMRVLGEVRDGLNGFTRYAARHTDPGL